MNLRVLKKDVDFVIEEFLSDALLAGTFAKEAEKQDKIMVLISEAIELRQDTYAKINHPTEGVTAKTYYNELVSSFYQTIDSLFNRLSEDLK